MKPTLILSLLCLTPVLATGQGLIRWGNNLTGFRAPIYGLEVHPEADGPIVGQSSLGIPAGTTVYHAPLLSGTGYTFGVYAGPASAIDSSSLTLLVSTTFRTGTGQLPNGLVSGGTRSVPGVAPGQRIQFQIRAWDNTRGSFFDAWPWARYTPMILSAPLGGVDSLGTLHPTPQTDGWTSFSFWIPEPSAILIGALAGAVFLGRTFLRSIRSKPIGVTHDQDSTPRIS